MSAPRVIVGAPLYNHAGELSVALESLLRQTYQDYVVLLVDDASTDDTATIARHYARADDRVSYYGNTRRLGMVGNWRRAFRLARTTYPEAEYFAWASDHDLWHPRWLEALVHALDTTPEVVLVYPLNRRIAADGQLTSKRPWRFDTAGVTNRWRRFLLTIRHMSAGNMTYGLARVAAIERAGVFRHVLVPDRLLLTELALEGQFSQVREVLWYRRWYGKIFSLGRQRRAFFPEGRPLHAYVPWWISHAVALGWILGIRGDRRPTISRRSGCALAACYLAVAGLLHARAELKQIRVRLLEHAPFLEPVYRGWNRTRRAALRRLGIKKRKDHYPTTAMTKPKPKPKRVATPRSAALGLVRSLPLMKRHVIPWLLRQEIDQIPAGPIAKTRDPVIVGPWLSEVGFEVLYWIPFLNWATEEFGLSRNQLIAVSRGGAGDWYQPLVGRAVDIFDLISVDEFRRRNEQRWAERGKQKQMAVGTFDRYVVKRVKAQLGLQRVTLLHPSLMYRLLRYYWADKGPASLLRAYTAFRPFPQPEVADIALDLPERFVAVRFYFRDSFPDTTENRALVNRIVGMLAERVPVVLLNTGMAVDDHADFSPGPDRRFHRIDHLMQPSRNLAIQSAVISRARAFVGTYGGLAYLGPYYGVPAVAVYSDPTAIVQAHLDASRRYSQALDVPLTTLQTGELALLGSLLPWDQLTETPSDARSPKPPEARDE